MRQQIALLLSVIVLSSVAHPRPGSDLLPDCTEGEEVLIGLGQIKCRERTGPAVLPDSDQIAAQLMELLGSLMTNSSGSNGANEDSMMSDVAAHIGMTLEEMNQLTKAMGTNQAEIDQTAQSLLPDVQRLSLHYGKAVQINRDRQHIVAEQIHQLSQSLPRDQFVEIQHRTTSATIALSAMRSDILSGKQSLPSADVTELLSIDRAIAKKTVHLALQTGEDEDVTNGDLTNVLQLDAEAPVGGSLIGLSLHDRTILIIDSLLASFKDLRSLQSKQLAVERDDWSADMDDYQRKMDLVVDNQHTFQALQAQTVLSQKRMSKYLRAITAQQYRLLEQYAADQTGMAKYGAHLDRSVKMKAAFPPVIDQLLHLVKYGDTQYTAPAYTGCDNFGAEVDVCGVCRGANNTCLACSGIPKDTSKLDVCGVCGDGLARDCSYFCDGKADSGETEDVCGVCGGSGIFCSGCDGMPHSPLKFDMCGVCGGDNQSCFAEKNCAEILKRSPCPVINIACPFGQIVSPAGFKGCCFDPNVDCVTPIQAHH